MVGKISLPQSCFADPSTDALRQHGSISEHGKPHWRGFEPSRVRLLQTQLATMLVGRVAALNVLMPGPVL